MECWQTWFCACLEQAITIAVSQESNSQVIGEDGISQRFLDSPVLFPPPSLLCYLLSHEEG